MFCSNCGSKLPDGSKHCSFCGAATAPAQPSYQAPAQPTYQAPPQPSYQAPAQSAPSYYPSFDSAPTYIPPQMPQYDLGPKIPENFVDRERVRKGKFLRSHADSTTKVMGLVALALAVVFAVTLFLAGSATVNGPIFDIPVIHLAMELSGDDAVEELEELRYDAMWDLQNLRYSGDLSRSEERLLDDAIKLLDRDFSIRSIMDAATVMAEYSNDHLSGMSEIPNQAVMGLIAFMINFFYILAGICLLIAVLRMGSGWIWPAMILAVLQALSLSGMVYAIVFLALGIALIVLLGKVSNAYASFKSGF